jgi:UPF0755 protein
LRTKGIDFSVSEFNKKDTIILASIVEKETGAGWERPKIAGVFINRLKKGMRLQSDPTVIYGIFPSYNGNITKKMLQTPTPYNTYTKRGLPPGPIAGPGLDAIYAVLSPDVKEGFLYFVSRNDGTHVFSKTYEDHNKAVITFQKDRKNRVGRSWRDLNRPN